jgi:hypothetical protein
MNRNIPAQVEYDRTNKGVDIRNPSTANFLIDSQDRAGYNASTVATGASVAISTAPANFTITKGGQNLITGFFTRMAMTEIVLNWNMFNVRVGTADLSGNNTTGLAVVDISASTVVYFPNIVIKQGNYTVKDALDALLVAINTATSQTFTLVDASTLAYPAGVKGRRAIIPPAGFALSFYRTTPIPASPAPYMPNLAQSLGFFTFDSTALPLQSSQFFLASIAYKPNLLPYNYIDITSPQLASQQKVKDATTSNFDAIDVIYRWVFANDEADPSAVDAYGYPILQGYLPFTSRRYLSFPKQVRWNPLLPIGNLQFQTYTDQEKILSYEGLVESYEFKMLMLLSEV